MATRFPKGTLVEDSNGVYEILALRTYEGQELYEVIQRVAKIPFAAFRCCPFFVFPESVTLVLKPQASRE